MFVATRIYHVPVGASYVRCRASARTHHTALAAVRFSVSPKHADKVSSYRSAFSNF